MPNYVADFYHRSLDGYKPPKTVKINIYTGMKVVLG